MSKVAVGVIVAGLIILGVFFYMGNTSDTVEVKQKEVADTVTKPLTDAKSVDALDEERQNTDKQKMDEAMAGN